jgi:sulfur carrier protein ThiS
MGREFQQILGFRSHPLAPELVCCQSHRLDTVTVETTHAVLNSAGVKSETAVLKVNGKKVLLAKKTQEGIICKVII